MAGQILNVNFEMNQMQQQISAIKHCRVLLDEVAVNAKLYQSNKRINILTIIATMYVLLTAFVSYNVALLVVGIGIGVISAYVLLALKTRICYVACVLIIAMIILAIVFFMFFYNVIPIIGILVQWIVVIINNYKMKYQIWKISIG